MLNHPLRQGLFFLILVDFLKHITVCIEVPSAAPATNDSKTPFGLQHGAWGNGSRTYTVTCTGDEKELRW